MAEEAINTEILRNETLENQIVNNMEKDYQEPTEIMVKQFQEMNNNINKEISKENDKFVNKLEIIKEVEKREEKALDNEDDKKEKVNLADIFKNMKMKSKDSDVIAATTSNKNLEERMDKLEQYMIDIIRNQQLILQKMKDE